MYKYSDCHLYLEATTQTHCKLIYYSATFNSKYITYRSVMLITVKDKMHRVKVNNLELDSYLLRVNTLCQTLKKEQNLPGAIANINMAACGFTGTWAWHCTGVKKKKFPH